MRCRENSERFLYADSSRFSYLHDVAYVCSSCRHMPAHNTPSTQVRWSYLRALQIEGNYPVDAGAWTVTASRLQFGEGLPNPDDKHFMVPISDAFSFPEVIPDIPTTRRHPDAWAHYCRFNTARSAERFLQRLGSPHIAISAPLSPGWITPPNGVIPVPRPGEVFFEDFHCFAIHSSNSTTRRFTFDNSWGHEWGESGRGYFPYDYFDRYAFEAYAMEPRYRTSPKPASSRAAPSFPGSLHPQIRRTQTRTHDGSRFHAITIDDGPARRYAWAFVRANDGHNDLEELYVRPEFRGHNLSRLLIDELFTIRRLTRQPIRVLVPWADTQRESPDSFDALCKSIRRLGCTFYPPLDIRSAYIACEGDNGSSRPIEPQIYATRPRAPMKDLLIKSALLAAFGSAVGPWNVDTFHTLPSLSPRDTEVVQVGLNELNHQRWQLVEREAAGSITPDELKQLEELQSKVRALVDRLDPPDISNLERMKELILRHGGTP